MASDSPDAKLNHLVAAQLCKTKMCAMFARGSCNDPKCRFAHSRSELRSAPDLTKTAVCRAFARGQCNNVKCKFAHGEQELRVTPSVYKTQLCNFFENGHCKKGDWCRHAHGVAELRSFEAAPQRPPAEHRTTAKNAGTPAEANLPPVGQHEHVKASKGAGSMREKSSQHSRAEKAAATATAAVFAAATAPPASSDERSRASSADTPPPPFVSPSAREWWKTEWPQPLLGNVLLDANPPRRHDIATDAQTPPLRDFGEPMKVPLPAFDSPSRVSSVSTAASPGTPVVHAPSPMGNCVQNDFVTNAAAAAAARVACAHSAQASMAAELALVAANAPQCSSTNRASAPQFSSTNRELDKDFNSIVRSLRSDLVLSAALQQFGFSDAGSLAQPTAPSKRVPPKSRYCHSNDTSMWHTNQRQCSTWVV
mmetsp:Transcript_34400/g.67777  ORF Transcript_34400/g.67777 Transcript_34400/m.67777 type:complete len:424 (+) Transcript_34400:66-1337(+)